MGAHWKFWVPVIPCLNSLAAFHLSQTWISSPCAWSTLSPYSLVSAMPLRRKPMILESAHTGDVCIKLVLHKAGNGLCCVMFSLPPTVNRCYRISWLFTNLAKVRKHFFLGVMLLCQCSTVWRVWGWGGAAYHSPKVFRGSSNQMAAMEVLCIVKALYKAGLFNKSSTVG